MGAWIEIGRNDYHGDAKTVAPLVGAWIEIECIRRMNPETPRVAPLVGAWIEI